MDFSLANQIDLKQNLFWNTHNFARFFCVQNENTIQVLKALDVHKNVSHK